jgi:hypothetical protein
MFERGEIPGRKLAGGRDRHANEESRMRDEEIREVLSQHWAASDSGDFVTEHNIYHDDAFLDYPQSRERIRGRENIQATRTLQPNKKHFVVHRINGSGDLWITEYVMTYDARPYYTVSIMQFRGVKVAHETQYFADPFEASEWRKKWVENMDRPKDQGAPTGAIPPSGA